MNGDVEILGQSNRGQHQFQAEVAELLNLMVHSVYSETDIFLRELISNVAIRLKPDAAAKTLTVADNGIGMDRQDLIDNLGTLARSDRPVRHRLLRSLHGRRPHYRDQPPGRHSRGMDLDIVRRRRLRDHTGKPGRRSAREARHRDRAASQGGRVAISPALRAGAHRPYLFGTHPFP